MVRTNFLVLDDLPLHAFNHSVGGLGRGELNLDLVLHKLHVAVLNLIFLNTFLDLVDELACDVPRHLRRADHNRRGLPVRRLGVHSLSHEVLPLVLHDCAAELLRVATSADAEVLRRDRADHVSFDIGQSGRAQALLLALRCNRVPDFLNLLQVLIFFSGAT